MKQGNDKLDEMLDAMADPTLKLKDKMGEGDLVRAKPMVKEAIGWAQEWIQKRRPTRGDGP